jgi:hypothetical protein
MTDDMEALIEGVALPWLEEAEQSFDTDELAKAGQAVRDLLKAYQERGRALEAASPVVPVGMRERVLDELDKAWLHGQRRTSWRRDESADAILAALRPTDTGRE